MLEEKKKRNQGFEDIILRVTKERERDTSIYIRIVEKNIFYPR